MKRLFQTLAVTLLSATSSELCAQHNWAMAFVEKEQDIPTVVEYHSAQETAENGIVYNRIFDDSYRIRGEVPSSYSMVTDGQTVQCSSRSWGWSRRSDRYNQRTHDFLCSSRNIAFRYVPHFQE